MHTTEIAIRPLMPTDAAAFLALRLAAIREMPEAVAATHEEEAAQSPAQVEARIAHTSTQVVLGAFHDGLLAGVSGLRRDARAQLAHKGALWGMYVQPAWRKDGVAKALLRELFAYASAHGIEQIVLGVNAQNERAQRLYRSLGFRSFGVEPRALRVGDRFYDEEQMVLMLAQGDPADI
jgi:ribosomal protein S18 acetylase RimI-like enzyme